MSSYNGLTAALKDMRGGFDLGPLWWRLGLEQTAARYRRTLIGPFWMAISTIGTGLALAVIFGGVLGGNWRETVPFILTGVTVWSVIAGVVTEGSQTFLNASGQMQVQKLPLSFHVFLQMHRALIGFMHQIVAYWITLILLGLFTVPHWELVLALPLVMAIGFFLSFPVGMLATRYRDFAQFVAILMSTLFMLTPVFWRRAQVSNEMIWIVDYNPFSYMLEVVRQPLLGHPAALRDWGVTLLILLVSIGLALFSLSTFRRRVVYWL